MEKQEHEMFLKSSKKHSYGMLLKRKIILLNKYKIFVLCSCEFSAVRLYLDT
jgi:hypothetical protein